MGKIHTECDEERLKLKNFSEKVADLTVDNDTLLRFLRAREGDILKAELMLRKSMKWREETEIASYRSWIPPKGIADDYVAEYIGLDKDGYPVVYIPLGRWNIRDRINDGFLKETVDFFLYILEGIVMVSIEQSKRSQVVVLLDMAQLNFHKIASIETMNVVGKTIQDFDANYPECLKAAVIINGPWVFPYAFSVIKPWIAPKTLQKIHIFDSNKSKWLPALHSSIPKEILPHFLA